MKLEDHLKTHFGYNEFRDSQKEIIAAVLDRRDVLAILPTGAGKSICYQLPALLLPGTAIVVSPLISLMQDQVVSLTKNNISAAFLNSSLPIEEIRLVMNNLSSYKLLYVTPERLTDPNFLATLQKIPISFFAIDEAHCISQWGHAFRPEYRQLSILKTTFPSASIIALTATATQDVQEDISAQLAMKTPHSVKASFDRPNLTIRIYAKKDAAQLQEFLTKHAEESGIIYASTRKAVDETYEVLRKKKLKVGRYHAGLSDAERAKNQHEFVYGKVDLMVATLAFGMGIHKPDIRFIVHINMPKSIEQYYQEIGRAGRDGLPAECVLFYSGQDIATYEFFLSQITDENVKRTTQLKTQKMFGLCCANRCRRKELLKYFSENYAESNCHSCDQCLDAHEMMDETVAAQKILSCVFRLQQRFGIKYVIDVLRGSKLKNIFDRGHDQLPTYGLMQEYSEADLHYRIDSLMNLGLLKRSEGEYPVLQWTEQTKIAIKGTEPILIPKKITQRPSRRKELTKVYHDTTLFQKLSALRMQIAQKANVPAFVVFGDRSLIEMAIHYPTTKEAFLNINGVGPAKWDKYGQAFLEVIVPYCIQNQILIQ